MELITLHILVEKDDRDYGEPLWGSDVISRALSKGCVAYKTVFEENGKPTPLVNGVHRRDKFNVKPYLEVIDENGGWKEKDRVRIVLEFGDGEPFAAELTDMDNYSLLCEARAKWHDWGTYSPPTRYTVSLVREYADER